MAESLTVYTTACKERFPLYGVCGCCGLRSRKTKGAEPPAKSQITCDKTVENI